MKYRFLTLAFACACNLQGTQLNLSELFRSDHMNEIIQKNRETLTKVSRWVEDDVYKNAFFWYGLPESVKHLIDLPIGNEVTYSDAIVALAHQLKKPINYLEIGVSLGKNFFQVLNAVSNANCFAFDIENINPTLERFFQNKKSLGTWPTSIKFPINPISLKKNDSSLTSYSYEPTNNQVAYLSGDIFDEKSWEQLCGKKYNLIFSDAYHHPAALLLEYDMLEKFNLLDDEFVIVWDDLGGDMSEAFYKIFKRLQQRFNLSDDNKSIVQLRGWLGIHEYCHNIGIIYKLSDK